MTGSVPPNRAAGVHPVSFQKYAHVIHQLRLRLDAGATDLARLARALSAVRSIRVHGHAMVVSVQPITRALQLDHLAAARTLVDQLDGALRAHGVAPPSLAQMRGLSRILNSYAFQKPVPNPLTLLINLVFVSLYRWLVDQSAHTSWALVLMGALTMAGAAVAALILGRRAMRGALADARVRPVLPTEVPMPDLLAEAGRLAREGRYRDALRLRLAAALASLRNANLLRLEVAATNRDYVAQLRHTTRSDARASSELTNAFEGLIDRFDRVWYGHEAIDGAGYARAEQLADALMTT